VSPDSRKNYYKKGEYFDGILWKRDFEVYPENIKNKNIDIYILKIYSLV